MVDDSFWEVQSDESRVKTAIVEDFFVGWARIIGAHQKKQQGRVALAYADLFAGRGVYLDGNESTAMRITRRVVENDVWRASTQLFFNERDGELLAHLQTSLATIPRYDELALKPIFTNDEVDANYRGCLKALEGRPTFYFVDPFGYKGISLDMLSDLVESFGNDLIFFFNYLRIRGAVSGDPFVERMHEIFGDRAVALRQEVALLHGYRRGKDPRRHARRAV
ncbi:MAG TPA: three-Cys-motif partner protein TcmP [Thermoanaerobaculia bacterium]|nr:three-Cys-motif partner protein TcmP [Thermoanaerobaculia bacterium]